MTPRRLALDDVDGFRSTLELIRREFAYMDGVIDPPSSMHQLTVDDLAHGPGEVWVIGLPSVACVVMTPKPEVLYVGKLAVAASERGHGLARRLLDQAETEPGS
ncbi:MAG: GNAT family N-acetyltransferase [Acidimicrobiales bacterium]